MSVLEAWSFCKPVFMTKACNLSLGFEANAAVEISNDPKQIARTLMDRLDFGELSDLGSKGRQLVEANFSWAHVGKQLDGLYRWLESGENMPAEVEI